MIVTDIRSTIPPSVRFSGPVTESTYGTYPRIYDRPRMITTGVMEESAATDVNDGHTEENLSILGVDMNNRTTSKLIKNK